MAYYLQQGLFVFRFHFLKKLASFSRKKWWSIFGMSIGRGTMISAIQLTWPHQVRIGEKCKVEPDVYFKYSGIWKPGPSIVIGNSVFLGYGCEFNIKERITIGDDCLIASGCRFVDHDHGMADVSKLIRFQPAIDGPIAVGNNVWLGCNVVVLKGVTIGAGAVVAAGAVVTKSIPGNEIWGGVPAKKIADRGAVMSTAEVRLASGFQGEKS